MKKYSNIALACVFGIMSHVVVTSFTRPDFDEDPLGMFIFALDTISIFFVIYLLIPTVLILVQSYYIKAEAVFFTSTVYIVWALLVLLFFTYHREILEHGFNLLNYDKKFWYIKQHWQVIIPPILAAVGYALGAGRTRY